MEKLQIPATVSTHGAVAGALSSANRAAMAPAMPKNVVNTEKQQPAVNTVPDTGGHPMLRRFQRTASRSGISDTLQNKLLHVIKTLCEKCEKPMSPQELHGIVPGCTAFKDTQNSNDDFDVYISLPFRLPHTDIVSKLEARVSTADGKVKMVILSLENAPIQREVLEEQYGELGTKFPLGESPLEMISYICDQPWGEIRFSYRQERPDLLANIVFDKTSK